MNAPSDPIVIQADAATAEASAHAIPSQGAEGVIVQQIVVEGAPEPEANSDIVKRSIVVAGHKTSVSLEDAFWHALKDIAREKGQSLRSLVAEVDAGRHGGNLSSAVRLFVLDHYRRRAGAALSVSGA